MAQAAVGLVLALVGEDLQQVGQDLVVAAAREGRQGDLEDLAAAGQVAGQDPAGRQHLQDLRLPFGDQRAQMGFDLGELAPHVGLGDRAGGNVGDEAGVLAGRGREQRVVQLPVGGGYFSVPQLGRGQVRGGLLDHVGQEQVGEDVADAPVGRRHVGQEPPGLGRQGDAEAGGRARRQQPVLDAVVGGADLFHVDVVVGEGPIGPGAGLVRVLVEVVVLWNDVCRPDSPGRGNAAGIRP